jgi:hypothetical protein
VREGVEEEQCKQPHLFIECLCRVDGKMLVGLALFSEVVLEVVVKDEQQ